MSWEPTDVNMNNGILNESNDIEAAMIDSAESRIHQNASSSLQTSLIEMETTLHNREKEIEEMKLSHSNEIDNVLLQQQRIRQELLQEQTVRHRSEINSLKEQLLVNGTDEDEREARRIEQLKNTLKHLHDKEMEKLQLVHQQEKLLLVEENNIQLTKLQEMCDEKIECNKKKLEELANEQIKQIHSQFMKSYNTIMKQKCECEESNQQLSSTVSDMQEQYGRITEEKRDMERQIQQLQERHIIEVDAMKKTSHVLEKRMSEWKEKASNLQERIDTTSPDNISDNEEMIKSLQEQLQKKEKELSERRKIATSNDDKEQMIETLQTRLLQQDELHEAKLSELETAHQLALEEVESNHIQEASLLEDSITETSKSQASLEFAEVHMKELQQQLNAYRNQEMNHKTAMEQTKIDQQKQLDEMKQKSDRKITESTDTHKQEIQHMKQQIEHLEKDILEKEAKYEMKLNEITGMRKTESDIETKKIVNDLKMEYVKKMEDMTSQHHQDIDEMKQSNASTLATTVETLKQNMITQTQELRHEHNTAIMKLKESLSTTGKQALREAQSRIIDLEMASREAEDTVKQVRPLQERIQKVETELRAKEVELSICQSELNNEQTTLSTIKQTMEEYIKKYNDSETVNVELKNNLIKERDEAIRQYKEMMQLKEDSIAAHQSHLLTHQSRITELTKELTQEREITRSLKNDMSEEMVQVDNDSSELTNVQSELTNVQSELLQAKERCSVLLKEWDEKETDQEKLRNELSNLQGSLANREREYNNQIASLQLEVQQTATNLTSTIDNLKETTVQLEDVLKERDELTSNKDELKTQLQSLEQQLTDSYKEVQENERERHQALLATIEDMRNTNMNTTDELEQLNKECTLVKEEKDVLLMRINELELEVQ